ncbi:tetratricopeptide repeat protein [Pseudodesulfovibrio sp. zrk46]|uniref:tetratricopeptide repeat protein n=1 Tax=Pseudodesulfovibrio sp. zrk46 TaxID=2725288 RepID=UPI001FFC67C3|nr:tetratricopeptide repeat protein [Pseudodesulfovibrio sp. zrk46]
MYPPSSELRFKAVNKMAEEVKFAELAGKESGRAPVVGQVSKTVAQPVVDSGNAVGGQVGGADGGVSQPIVQSDQVTGTVSPPPVSSGEGQAGGSVAPPPGAQPVQQPVSQPVQQQAVTQGVEQPSGGVSGVVAPPPGTQTVSGQGSVGGAVAPPPTVVEGAPPPAPTPEESQQLSVAEQIAQQEGGTVAPPPVQADVQPAEMAVAPDDAVQPGTEGEPPAMDNATAAAKAREQEIRDKLYEAQNMMFNGALATALPLYEEILKQPDVPDDVREETLYAVADIKKEMHKDELEDYFEEISQAFIEAMNSNLRSNRVPRSLLNLGLLNLRVGNFPEAKAYFKILQEKYPDDDNIPSISYYWGEYYYRKGDFKKAADQFQYLIQTFPEHELVKQAAYYLADSLNRTGFVDQAYQIVDYIDKRWPDYYMENPQFLRLAGNVEMKLRKWPQAKNHFFTYYNLNPEADGSDVVLARLGDIYIRENEKDAARLIYQKVVQDYPDKEGGLVAKMRLAEEGIYDEPAMAAMATVFDRPYNKRPENIYKEIINDHPESPLAPIAQLKLAMWYAFNKKYPEALAAAQDFIEKHPDSPFVDRARKLGDSVFALAVPGMVAEERYGRIVRYWETYDFIGTEDTKVDDRTRLNVATSYWKVDQPVKALEIIKPFLGKRQIPEISDEALGLAVNIYLDELAWKEIADLVAMAKSNWKLNPEQLRQLDYARAMSLQNLGDSNKALAMWAELAKDTKVDPAFRAYAMYYMAKAAMERQDLRKVFVYAQEALSLLLQTKGDPEKIKDVVLMSIYATERSGRYTEALKWAKQYDEYIDVDNPEWASTRFKLARIYRKAGAMDEWKQLLTDIIEKKPESLQAQLAKSALDTYDLEQQVQQYSPAPQ